MTPELSGTLPTAHAAPPSIASDPSAEGSLEWSFNPWRQNRRAAVVGVIALLAVAGVVLRLELSPLARAALLLAFVAALGPAFLETRCRVDGEGVARRIALSWTRRAWRDIRRAVIRPDGLFVSPLAGPGPLASLRGLWLPVPSVTATALLPELKRRLARHDL